MPTWKDIRKTDDLKAEHDLRSFKSYAIQSQYSASPVMLKLMNSFQEQLDPSADIETFYENIFDIHSASGWGLDNWGRILNITRLVEDDDITITLDDKPYRLLLLYKALANISPSNAESLNHLLNELLNTGAGDFGGDLRKSYVLEVDTMVIRWVFEDFMDSIHKAIFKKAGTLARGAGVGWELYALNPGKVFGFNGQEMHPFNQAPFAPDDALIQGL